jgi:hypothetical protein
MSVHMVCAYTPCVQTHKYNNIHITLTASLPPSNSPDPASDLCTCQTSHPSAGTHPCFPPIYRPNDSLSPRMREAAAGTHQGLEKTP